MEQLVKKKAIVSAFLKANVLVSRDVLAKLSEPDVVEEWHAELEKGATPEQLMNGTEQVQNVQEQASQEGGQDGPNQQDSKDAKVNPSVRIVWEYDDNPKKRSVQDFVDYFNARYRQLEKILRSRSELQNLTSIARLRGKRDKEKLSIIGMVQNKQETKNGHLMLTLEDTSGSIRVLVSKGKEETFTLAQDIVFDEVIGVHGTPGDDIVFADEVVIPDVPIGEFKRAPDEAYVALLSCVHVGSAGFEKEKFERFVKWANGEWGDEKQKHVAKKLKYIFIVGDVVDGVGIYPGQDKELSIKSIREQYRVFAELFDQIRKDVTLVIGPGNHDAGRITEPQPRLSKDYAAPLYELSNAVMVCNPCLVNIHASDDFPGFNVLMYHGYSFDDYAEIVPSIKNSGLHLSDRVTLIMRFLLQRRHLAPQHGTTMYIPDSRYDPLVISEVPDLFFAGHIHKAGSLQYRNVSLCAGSCFQAKTDFQEKVGHEPDPGVVPVMNLQSRDVYMMRF